MKAKRGGVRVMDVRASTLARVRGVLGAADYGQLSVAAAAGRRYRATHPPHTGNTCPTKQLAASLHR